MLKSTRELEMYNLDLSLEKVTEAKPETRMTQNVLDLSCKSRTSSSSSIRNLTDTWSLSTSTKRLNDVDHGDQHEQSNISDAERSSPYGTVLMSPYSDTNSPKRVKLNNESMAAANNSFPNSYSASMIVPSAMMPLMYPPPHLLSNAEPISDAPRELFSTSSPLPTSFAQVSQSVPLGEVPRIIPQRFPPMNMLSTVASSKETDTSAVPQAETIKKVTRPFKAYPKDSVCFNKDEYEKYVRFRDRLMQSVKKISENPNPKMRRTTKSPALLNSTIEEKDAAYWERRRKNNAAAKRSRDARRAKEDELAIRAAFFEHENQMLKNELEYLRRICMFYKIDIDVYSTKQS